MVIREAGILFRGYTLINGTYHQTSGDHIDRDLRSGLLTALLNFAETAFDKSLIEYIEGKKYVIAFTQDHLISKDFGEEEMLVSYAILDKEKKIDKYVHRAVIPMLKEVLIQFKEKYKHIELFSEISKFRDFKKNLDSIFGLDTKTIDERFKGFL